MKWIPRVALLLLTLCLLTGCVRYGAPMYDVPDWDEPVQTTIPSEDIPQLWDSSLWDLQASRLCFGLNRDYETCFTVRARNVQAVSLVHDGSVVCEMVDNGTDGDVYAADGIYTCTVTNYSDEVGADQLYAVSGDLSSEPVTLYYLDTPTQEQLQTFEGAQLTIRSYFSSAADSEGFVDPSDVPALLDQAEYFISNLHQRGSVLYYRVYDTHITAKFDCGITAVYMPPLAEVDGGTGDCSVYTFQPFYENYPASIDPYLDFPDKAAQLLHATFDHCSWNGNNDENAVTLDSVRAFEPNEIILWHGHGGYDENLGPFLVTGQRYDRDRMLEREYYEDVINDRVISVMDNRLAFTAAFVDERCGSLDGSFLYLGSCSSGQDSRLADAFLRKGAKAVVANTDTISTIYNLSMQYQTVEYMCQIDPATANAYTLEKALALSMEKLGENDFRFSLDPNRDAHPVIFGGYEAENYRFGSVWAGVLPEEPTTEEPTTEEPTTEPPSTQPPTEPVAADPYPDYKWFLESYTWVDYVASDLSEIPADQYDEYWMGSYSLYDVNGDGVEELIIECGQSFFDTSYNFYTWYEGEIYTMGAIFAESGLYRPADGGDCILVRYAHGDIEELTCLEMTWDGLKILWQQEYYYQREDYVDPKEGNWIWLEAYSVHDTSILN